MKVCVFGLWHLGAVTACCLAKAGHEVHALDFDAAVIAGLNRAEPPLFEPGLTELLAEGLASGDLSFTTEVAEAVAEAEVLWVTFDTPVDDRDVADVDFVVTRIRQVLPALAPETLVLISSQLPVGTTRQLQQDAARLCPDSRLSFAYSPENLRLGGAIDAFTKPDRVVVGLDDSQLERDRDRITLLLRPFDCHLEWMSIESAEMTKHALNAFLATSVAFINEVSVLCERVGADASQVARGLKSEKRIGPRAYLSPGAAYAGGTLARDVTILEQRGRDHLLPMDLLHAVQTSNANHRLWVHSTLKRVVGDLANARIAVWGLTYKSGTDTLRRSDAVQLCRWLSSNGATVRAYDPAIKQLPAELVNEFSIVQSPLEAAEDAQALVIANNSVEYHAFDAAAITARMKNPTIIDPNRFLENSLGTSVGINYFTIGRPAAVG